MGVKCAYRRICTEERPLDRIAFKPPETISLGDIAAQAAKATSMMEDIRASMLNPTSRKASPLFNLTQLAAMCGLEKGSLSHRMAKGDLPSGNLNVSGSRREFTLAEARTWIREFHKDRLRPSGAEAVTISVGNFKGGVGKTTTAMTLAQGLTLLGHRVLVIDTDPQGSLTTLFGILPDTEVDEQDTILPLCMGSETSIRYAIKPTYWDGIDLVAAAPVLFGAEFALPARQTQEPGFEFWNVLNYGIDDVRADYDVIVIDTPPALSYVTINALMAADGVIMPLPPSALDFASSAQFWDLFSDLCTQLIRSRGQDKSFEFIDVLLSRVESSDAASSVVRQWIQEAYGDKVLPIEIPKTAVAATASAEFGTVYDMPRGSMNSKTMARARDAYDRMCELVEQQVGAVWANQTGG
jgi:chromosome partitioning protein